MKKVQELNPFKSVKFIFGDKINRISKASGLAALEGELICLHR